MWNIFEQPWTLILVAVAVLIVIAVVRAVLPDKKHWWQWLFPLVIVAAAFGIDFYVKTDLEKIRKLIDFGVKAVEKEDCDAIEKIIDENYRDSYHYNKTALMQKCQSLLRLNFISKVHASIKQKNISANNATFEVFARILFDENSEIYSYLKFMLIKAELKLQKNADGKWLISQAEILEVNNQPSNWKGIRNGGW